MKTVLTTPEAMEKLCRALQGSLIVDWSQVEVEPINLDASIWPVKGELKSLSRQITRENLSARP